MLKDIKNILITALFIIVAILLFKTGCNKPTIDLSPKIDTLIHSDTVWGSDTIIKFKSIKTPKWDTIYKIDTLEYSGDPEDLFFTREYNDSLSDTNQTVFYNIRTFGMLDSLSIKYKLKVPIKITDSVFITKTNPLPTQSRFSINTGLEVGGNVSTFNLSPFINLNIKNNNIYYRYGVLDRTHSIGVGIRIFKSKK